VHIASAESWWIVEVAIPRTAALPPKKKQKHQMMYKDKTARFSDNAYIYKEVPHGVSMDSIDTHCS
jgi:hypothetical protein